MEVIGAGTGTSTDTVKREGQKELSSASSFLFLEDQWAQWSKGSGRLVGWGDGMDGICI